MHKLIATGLVMWTCHANAVPGRGGQFAQFDVFLGMGTESIVPEGSWFPIVLEIKNDGPPFVGTIQIQDGSFSQNTQSRQLSVELPTGTLKRISIPVFASSRYNSRWDVKLYDDRGRLRADRSSLAPSRQVATGTPLIGAVPRTSGGQPVIRQINRPQQEMQPAVARFQSQLLPDNPLVFEGMDTLYINSEKAPDLTEAQVNAVMAWLNAGGHLVIGVESASDVNGTPWLKSLVPCDLAGAKSVKSHGELQQWLQRPTQSFSRSPATRVRTSYANPFANLDTDSAFENAELPVTLATPHGGEVVVSSEGTPLVMTSRAGRGRVTTLLFSPERGPLRSADVTWKNLPTFWAKVCQVPADLYVTDNYFGRGNYSIDGVFGAMIDSKQIRKLPVEWLLLLLILYLLVIGPLDQFWLKRIKRPMLTWITFPCYVVLFSLLIYFIGYKLRAGETEWNELHMVDVLPRGEGAELHGRTYSSVYSPVNATYKVESQLEYSTFRGELQNFGGSSDERTDVQQKGDNFAANIFVHVWTSQLFVSDWWQASQLPFTFTVTPDNQGWSVTVNNKRDKPLNTLHLVIGGRLVELTAVPAGQSKTFTVQRTQGQALGDFVRQRTSGFQEASNSRRRAFGSTSSGRIADVPNSTLAVSFISYGDQWNFNCPPGMDLSVLADQGNAILLAWESDFSPIQPINQFPTRRNHKDTLWRMAIPLNTAAAPTP
jgi:hypothetical protein